MYLLHARLFESCLCIMFNHEFICVEFTVFVYRLKQNRRISYGTSIQNITSTTPSAICTSYPAWGRGTPFPPLLLPCPFTSSSFAFHYFSLFPFLVHFTYFLLLSIRSLSTRIAPLRFQAWGRRRRPNLGLVCFCLWLCYLYCLVKIYSVVLLYLV